LHSLPQWNDREEVFEDEFLTLPKYMIINLAAATELLLKARLCKEHWSLIFQSIDKASVDAVETGEFTSVDFDTSIERLNRIASISLSQSTRDTLKALRKRRNLYEHLRIEAGLYAVIPLATQCLNVILDEIMTWFQPNDFDEDTTTMLETLRPRLAAFTDLRKHRLSSLSQQLNPLRQAGLLVNCPICSQQTLEIGPDTKCLYCSWVAPSTEAARRIADNEEQEREYGLIQPRLFPEPPLPYVRVVNCPKCDVLTFLVRSNDEVGMQVASDICYNCGYRSEGQNQ
jgi:hypothetical protein